MYTLSNVTSRTSQLSGVTTTIHSQCLISFCRLSLFSYYLKFSNFFHRFHLIQHFTFYKKNHTKKIHFKNNRKKINSIFFQRMRRIRRPVPTGGQRYEGRKHYYYKGTKY